MSPESVTMRQSLNARYEEGMRIVSFEVGDQEFALDITSVVGVAPSSVEERSTALDPLLHGVKLFRNERVPVVSLRTRFGLNDVASPTPQAWILFVEIEDSIVGLRIDVLRSTQRVLRGEIEPIPPRLYREHDRYVRGAIRTGDRLTLLIDADRLLSADEKALLAQSVKLVELNYERASPQPYVSTRSIAPA